MISFTYFLKKGLTCTKIDNRWIERDSIPDGVTTRVLCKLNEQQFIFASDKDQYNGLYVYYIHSGKFQKLFEYPKKMKSEFSLRFNASNNMLYCTGYKYPMFLIDMKQNKIMRWKKTDCFAARLLSINGQIHLIGGWKTHRHLKWHDESQCFSEMFDFGKNLGYDVDISAVYVPTKGEIVMIVYGEENIIIWKFSFKIIQWKEIIRFPFEDHMVESISLTSDEKYV